MENKAFPLLIAVLYFLLGFLLLFLMVVASFILGLFEWETGSGISFMTVITVIVHMALSISIPFLLVFIQGRYHKNYFYIWSVCLALPFFLYSGEFEHSSKLLCMLMGAVAGVSGVIGGYKGKSYVENREELSESV